MSKPRKPRRIVTRSGYGHRGLFASAKMDAAIEFESTLERDACLLMEFSTGIAAYRAQPVVITTDGLGEIRQYTPDYEVIYSTGCDEYWEIKPVAQLEREKVRQRLMSLTKYFDTSGPPLRIVTCNEIRRQPRIANLRLLAKYRSPRIEPVTGELRALLPMRQTPFVDLVRLLDAETTLRLLADQHLFFDYDRPLSDNTLISTRGGDNASILL